MKYKYIIVISMLLIALVSCSTAQDNNSTDHRLTIIEGQYQQPVHESHAMWKYHVAANHTKSNNIIHVKNSNN